MPPQLTHSRAVSPNEQRAISREALGFYHAVIIGGVYQFPEGAPVHEPSFYFHPVKRCIEEHPFLSTIVGDDDKDKSSYHRVSSIDLMDHISIDAGTSVQADHELGVIEKMLRPLLDQPFPSGIPGWTVNILLLSANVCFIAFAYSHGIGDGASGVAFHRAFLDACRNRTDGTAPEDLRVVETPKQKLGDPFDTPDRLKISWAFLLAPLLGHYLPGFLANFLGLQGKLSSVTANTWTGSRVPPKLVPSRSKIRVQEIKAPVLQRLLQTCRMHDTKLTGTIHQLITRALSQAIHDPNVTNFVSGTPLNMRRSIGLPKNEMGNIVSVCYMAHPRDDSTSSLSETNWTNARLTTLNLAERASALQDQPIGLLRYVSSVRNWTLGRLGQQRDNSFEVSNVGVFGNTEQGTQVGDEPELIKMVFAQPGHVLSSPLCFNFASVKGGSLVFTVTWQQGALGIEESDEDKFVDDVCAFMQADIERLS
ncbi:Fc.00g028910.m01.CDS01 [Cosmosporella sp. VM-42]